MSTEGDIVTVILWHGEYRNDGLEVLDRLAEQRPHELGMLRIEGSPRRWFVVADAKRYQP